MRPRSGDIPERRGGKVPFTVTEPPSCVAIHGSSSAGIPRCWLRCRVIVGLIDKALKASARRDLWERPELSR